MTDESYIIAFTQGSSGRFALYLLTNLLTDSSDELNLCPYTNSTHKSDWDRYVGHSPIIDPQDAKNFGNSHPNIWNTVKFDDPLLEPDAPRIFTTHRFPDFKLIKERLGPNVKIIIITVDLEHLTEIITNDKLKNYYDLLTGRAREVRNFATVMPELLQRYERFLGKRYPGEFVKEDIIQIGKTLAGHSKEYVFLKNLSKGGRVKFNRKIDEDFETRIEKYLNIPTDIDYPMDQILFLPYSEIANCVGNEFVWLKKLEVFTGKTANTVTKSSYQQYIDGREKLLKEYRL
jgi:hypothetical protein